MSIAAVKFEYEHFFALVESLRLADAVELKELAAKVYIATAHRDYIKHAIALYYSNRKVFDSHSKIIASMLIDFDAQGLGISNVHTTAFLISCERSNIKQFGEHIRSALRDIPVDTLRFACRVMKNRGTLQNILDLMFRYKNELIQTPAQLLFVEQSLAKFLPEQYRQYVDEMKSLFLSVSERKNDFPSSDKNILDLLSVHYSNSKKFDASYGEPSLLANSGTIFNLLTSKPKVAVCISGQLRGFEEAHQKMAPFFDAFGAERFVHTWADAGRGMLVPDRADRWFSGEFLTEFRSLCAEGKLNGKKFLNLYPAFNNIEGEITVDKLKNVYGTDNVSSEVDQGDLPSNHHKMFYKIWCCHKMMLESARKFDVIIRVRPDLVFDADAVDWDGLLYRAQHEKIVWVETEFGVNRSKGWVGDQFAVGSLEAITTYASIFPLASQLETGLLGAPIIQAHEALGFHMWKHGFSMPKAPITNNRLVEIAKFGPSDLSGLLNSGNAASIDKDIDKRLKAANQRDLQSK
jgi:NAD(P)H-dependent FMN reductase